MVAFVVLLVVLLLLGILGAIVKGLLWLTFIAVVLLIAGAAFGWFKFMRRRST